MAGDDSIRTSARLIGYRYVVVATHEPGAEKQERSQPDDRTSATADPRHYRSPPHAKELHGVVDVVGEALRHPAAVRRTTVTGLIQAFDPPLISVDRRQLGREEERAACVDQHVARKGGRVEQKHRLGRDHVVAGEAAASDAEPPEDGPSEIHVRGRKVDGGGGPAPHAGKQRRQVSGLDLRRCSDFPDVGARGRR